MNDNTSHRDRTVKPRRTRKYKNAVAQNQLHLSGASLSGPKNQLILDNITNSGRASSEDGTGLPHTKIVHYTSNLQVEPEDGFGESCRKRRRTCSPKPDKLKVNHSSNDWKEQLVQAAFHESSSDCASEPESQVKEIQRLSDEVLKEQGAFDDSKATQHKPINQLTDIEPSRMMKTPPRKMMKLRTDGKLGSPRSQENGVNKPKRKSKGFSHGTKGSSKLAIMRYGCDAESRVIIGQKITILLEGGLSLMTSSIETALSQPALKPTTGPPKLTHPFFLGKAERKAELEQGTLTITATEDGTLKKQHDNISPRKRQSTSRRGSFNGSRDAQELRAGSAFNGFSALTKLPKFLGAIEPLWPPKDMVHLRGYDSQLSHAENNVTRLSVKHIKKLKNATIRLLEEEEVLHPGKLLSRNKRKGSEWPGRRLDNTSQFHKPHRLVITRPQLQQTTASRIQSHLPPVPSSELPNVLGSSQDSPSDISWAHPAIVNIFNRITNSTNAFDRFECESQDWTSKYAPKHSTAVLQPVQKMHLLRHWLIGTTVSSIDDGTIPLTNGGLPVPAPKRRLKPKKRKVMSELDDFIVGSDEDTNDTDEVTEPEESALPLGLALRFRKPLLETSDNPNIRKLSKGGFRSTRAVLISGPHGCGKTAAVYAIAEELGFEVFEVNPGSRRSGKDILDKVGDMTKNHLVHQASEVDEEPGSDRDGHEKVQDQIERGQRKGMQGFFQPKGRIKGNGRTMAQKIQESPKKARRQKQSLILLEEVDILFEEDRQFWATVITLLANSKRPIIMTCTDEGRIPLQELQSCAVLSLSQSPESLATDYLLLLAANEGHLLSRDAVSILYRSNNFDLRASIMDLNFWCQMALGDTKGGLQWMLLHSNTDESQNEHGDVLRVISESTFTTHMSVLSHKDGTTSTDCLDHDVDLLCEGMESWKYDAEDWIDFLSAESDGSSVDGQLTMSLREMELSFDVLSAADIMPGSAVFSPQAVGR